MEGLVNNPWVGRALVTLCVLVEHVQVMSYGNRMIGSEYSNWTPDAKDTFDGMKKIALRLTDSGFMAIFVLSMIFSVLGLLIYFALMPQIHLWNRKPGISSTCIALVDNVIYGMGFVPMISVFSEIQYCDDNGNILDYSSTACWGTKQLTMTVFGFFGASCALVMSAAICPILKSERKGVEVRYVDEVYFPGLFKLLEVGIINIFAAVHHAYLGIIACGALIIYMGLFQCYRDPFVAAIKMSVLWGQLWVFCCAQEVTNDHERGSKMLIGWIPFMLLGYVIMLAQWFFWRSKNNTLALEKQYT